MRPVKILTSILFCFFGFNLHADEPPKYSVQESKKFISNYSHSQMMSGGDKARYLYLNISETHPSTIVDRAGPIRELPHVPQAEIGRFITSSTFGNLSLNDYIINSGADAVVILHHGKIVYENYPHMRDFQKHITFSVSKVFISAMVGILEREGRVKVHNPISSYISELADSDWEDVKVIDLLDMTTGICENPTSDNYDCVTGFYAEYNSDPDKLLNYYAKMKSHRPAGEAFEYSNVASTLLSILIERITERKTADVFGDLIWRPMGAESDAIITNAPNLTPNFIGFVATTARDLARFGLLFTPSGRMEDNNIIPSKHLNDIQRHGRPHLLANASGLDLDIFQSKMPPYLFEGELPNHNSYQWDVVMKDGDFYKGGSNGQGLYVSPKKDLVIVFFGHQKSDSGRVSRQLALSDLFNE